MTTVTYSSVLFQARGAYART